MSIYHLFLGLPITMSSILNEEASILHQALLNCIRRCEDSHGRRAYLCLIEHVISGCPGNLKFYTTFYDQLSLSIEEINKTVMFEIQQCKMEQQVSSLGLDCSPPKNDLNVIPDKSVLNTEHDVMADDSSDDSDFIDLNDLIFESVNNDFELLSNENIALNSQDSIASSFDLQLNLNKDVEQPSEIELDDGVFLPTDNIDLKCAPEQDDKQKSLYSSPIMPDPLVDVNNQVRPCSLSLNEAGVYVPVNAPSSAPAQLTSRIPMSTRPPGTVPPPISVYPVAHARPPGPRLPGATRPPISDSPVTYTQPLGTAPPPIISDYPVTHGTRPPGTASPLFTDYPITHTRTPGKALPVSDPPFTQTRPPNVATAIADSRHPITPSMNGILAEPSEHFKFVDIVPNSDANCTQHDFPALVSPNPESNPLISTDKTDQSTRAPAGAIPIGISNAVPKVPFTLVRPRGFLPVQTLPSPTEPTPPTSSRPSVTPVAQRPFTSDAMPPPPPRTPTTPDEYPSPRYETRALPDNLSRQNTRSSSDYSSADLGDSKEYHRSSSGESGGGSVGITKPDTHRGSTVYRSKRISHSQLLAFLDDSTLKSDLKELGAVYLISACDDANFYNVSLSGNFKLVSIFTIINSCLL